MKLSIVSTLYRSSPHLREFHKRASAAAKLLAGDDYEIVLVNDGSPDDSLDIALDLTREDPKVVVVDLSRNFGHHKAMMTGLDHCRGALVFLIDSDLEEEPEWMHSFNTDLETMGADVVYGVQRTRRGSAMERWSGKLFYSAFRRLSGIELPENLVTARLMTRRYVDALLLHREREITIAGLWTITGFHQVPHAVDKKAGSETSYTLARKFSILIGAVTSFSNAPLIGIFYVGLFISTFALIYVIYILLNWALAGTPPDGWTSLIGSVWLLGGMIIAFVGVVGIYLAKVFSETKQRPYTIVRAIHGQQKG